MTRSEGFPRFLQDWGDLLWERTAARTGASITVEDVETAAPEFERRRQDHHRLRCRQLEGRRLLPAARAIAEAFAGAPALPHHEVEDAVRRALGPAGEAAGTYAALTAMEDLGFLWRPGPTPAWEPTLPSLVDTIREYAPGS